jgi:hypothetical protein
MLPIRSDFHGSGSRHLRVIPANAAMTFKSGEAEGHPSAGAQKDAGETEAG